MTKMQELFEKVSMDPVLLQRFSVIMKDAEKAGGDATKEKLTDFAKDNEFDISVDEMKDYFKELAESKETALSDAELDMVAGGKASGDQIKRLGHEVLDDYIRSPNRMLYGIYEFFEQK